MSHEPAGQSTHHIPASEPSLSQVTAASSLEETTLPDIEDLSERRKAGIDTLNFIGGDLEGAVTIHDVPSIRAAIQRIEELKCLVNGGGLDDILSEDAPYHAISGEEFGTKLRFFKVFFLRLANETGMFEGIDKFSNLQKDQLLLSRRIESFLETGAAERSFQLISFIDYSCRDVSNGEFAFIFRGLSPIFFNYFHPPAKYAIPLFYKRAAQVFLVFDGVINGYPFESLCAAGALQYIAKRYVDSIPPNSHIRDAFAMEAITQIGTQCGQLWPYTQPGWEMRPSESYTALLLRALRLGGERQEYVDSLILSAEFDSKRGTFSNLEEAVDSVKTDLEVTNNDDFHTVLRGLHAVQVLKGFEDRIKGLRIANEVIAGLESA